MAVKLSKLLEKMEYTVLNDSVLIDDVEVNHLIYDSRKVEKEDVFVCIVGANSDGHDYIASVVSSGAKAIIVQKDIEITNELKDVIFIKTEDTRLALAYMSAAYFDYPALELKTIGLTGTKGKTTTTYMIKDILEKCNIKTGLIGTIETIIGDTHIKSSNTTPESYIVQEYFRRMVEEGCECVVMEVSSQALMLHRTAGIEFDFGIFTNLEPDHISPNEHKDFNDYMSCKARLFRQCKQGIANADCEHTEEVMSNRTCELFTYGIDNKADLMANNILYKHENGNITTEYEVSGTKEMEIKLSLPGKFSVYNSLCAISVAGFFNVSEDLLKKALLEVKVAGRVEPVKVSDEFTIMIDYAHNAMSLESLLSTLREYNPERIVTIFGCGGNRAKSRRFEMGEVSGKMSDLTIITSDNPRFEEPIDIINDIETGIKKTDGEYVKIIDRKDAIKYALENGRKGDIIVVAGKGHEDYHEVKGVKYHQTDRELIEQAAKELNM